MPIEVHREHRPRYQPTGNAWEAAHRLGQFVQINVSRRCIHVDQDGRCTREFDGRNARHGGMRDGENRIARTDAERAQGQIDRIGAVRDSDHVLDSQPGGERLLEPGNLAAQDIPSAFQDARDAGVDIVPIAPITRRQVDDGNADFTHVR